MATAVALQTAGITLAAGLLGGLPPILRHWSEPALHRLVALSAGVFLGSVGHLSIELLGIEGIGFGAHDHGHAAGHAATGAHDHAHDHGASAAFLEIGSVWIWIVFAIGCLGWLALDKLLLEARLARPASADPHHGLVWRASYIGLALHAVLAGFGLASLLAVPRTGVAVGALVAALSVHKAIETFSLGTLMRLGRLERRRAILWMLLFCTLTPLALFAGSAIVERLERWGPLAAAFSAGTFASVTLFHLLPEALHEKARRNSQIVLIAVGVVAAWFVPALIEGRGDLPARMGAETLAVFLELSPFLLLGFLAAGAISQALDPKRLQRLFAKDDARSIGLASIVGAPLPLCSCSVVPVAASLRDAGAGRGATSAFLIATPETGVDSVASTWALMDPVMTIARPVAAVSTAMATGLAVASVKNAESPEPEPQVETSCCHAAQGDDTTVLDEPTERERPSAAKALRYGFVDLVDDLAWPLVLGVVLSGLMAAALPVDLFESSALSGIRQHLLMLAIGLPVYVCAAASTPIAAALVAKGLAPGAALVFLLASPATNLGSLVIVRRLLGSRGLVVHLAVLSTLTLLAGLLVDVVYRTLDIAPRGFADGHHHLLPHWLHVSAAVVLAALLVASFIRALGIGSPDAEHVHEHDLGAA